MKIFAAHFTSECNEHISHTVSLDEFKILYGDECLEAMHIKEVFKENDIEVVPAIFAALHPNGMIQKEAFDFISDTIISSIREHRDSIDGIYLQLHGASGVLELDCVSGEHYIIKEIRKIVGKYMPIALVMDPHGNITKEISDRVNIVRCYRESPHFDQIETEQLVARKLIDLLKNRRTMHPVIRKLPILIGGERSVSAKEPVRTINDMLDKAEEDPRVFSSSYHVGYLRHDDDTLGAAVVVVPNTSADRDYCETVAELISTYAWNHRHEFKFSGNFDSASQSVKKAIAFEGKTAVITDSGDNCGAGGSGQNTLVLEELIKQDTKGKRVLIAGINDPRAYHYLSTQKIGDSVSFNLGFGEDENSQPQKIEGVLKVVGDAMYGLTGNHTVGKAYTVSIKNSTVDVLVMNRNVQYGNMEQFHKAGLEFHDYDIVVVKMGYLDVHLVPETAYHIMALTDGPTIQESERIPYRRISRPMWPIDDVEILEYIK